MNVERKFHSVGQGAFYTEKIYDDFNEYNIVYDCGSTTTNNSSILRREIDNQFSQGDIIDILFISHLHKDHINGIEDLMKKCAIKNIVLPLMNPTEIFILSNNYFRNQTTLHMPYNINGFLNKLRESGINLIYIDPNQEGEEQIFISNSSNPDIVTNSVLRNFDWIFKLHIHNYTNQRILFEQELICQNIDINNIDLSNQSNRNNLKRIYERIYKNANIGSLVIFSNGLVNVKGALYLGDYDCFSSDTWKSFFKRYCNDFVNLSTLQIPHHGSKGSFNTKLLSNNLFQSNNINYIISHGISNPYRHPHTQVLNSFYQNNINVRSITESIYTRFIENL